MSSVTIATWQGLLANQQQQLARSAQSPSIKDAVDYFTTKAPQITSIDQVMQDPKLLNSILTTYGLQSEAQFPARLRALLTQDPTSPQSLVNRLVDPRYTTLVKDLSFFDGPPAGLKDPAYIAKFTQTYQTNAFEQNLGTQDPALREAAYFARNIGNVVNVDQILSDKVLTDVVEKALQLPAEFSGVDFTQQESILKSRLNLSSLQSTAAHNAALFQNATDDQAQIDDATKLSTAASTVVDGLNTDLGNIKSAYDALALRQDPNGTNAAKIAAQNGYVPQLTQVRGLLDAAKTRTSDLTGSIDALTQMMQSAPGLSASDLAASKSQFDQTVARLKQNLDNATYLDPSTGTASNLLEDPSFSVTITPSAGHAFTFQGTDLSSIKSALDSAQSQFDALSAGGTFSGTIATDLSGARSTSVSAADYLNTQLRTYNSLLENVDPTISSAQQQGLVDRAASSSAAALSRAGQIADKLSQLSTLLDTGSGTIDANGATVDHNQVDQNVQQLKSDILSLITTSGSGTDNLLTGNGEYGAENGVTLSIQGLDLVAQLSDKLTNVGAATVASSQSGATLVEKTLQPLLATLTNNLVIQANYVQQAATSAAFAVTVDTNALAQATQSAADSIDRTTQIGTLLGQLQQLAKSAAAAGGDATAAAQVADLQSKIGTLINTPGSGDDNLLTGGGTQAYAYLGSTQLYVRKGDLNNTVANAIAGIDLSTQAGAQAASDLIAKTVLPGLSDVRTTITSDSLTATNARFTFDGRTAIDNRLIATTSSVADRVAGATVTVKNTAQPVNDGTGTIDPQTGLVVPTTPPPTVDKNLLTSSADTLVFLKSATGSFDIAGQGGFDTKVTQPLIGAVNNLFKTPTSPGAAVGAAVQALIDISIGLHTDLNALKFGTQSVTDLMAQKAQAAASQAAAQYQATPAAQQMVMQFLAVSADPANSGSASLADLFNGNASTANILNLLL